MTNDRIQDQRLALIIAMVALQKISKTKISQDNAGPPAHRMRFNAKEALTRVEKLVGPI